MRFLPLFLLALAPGLPSPLTAAAAKSAPELAYVITAEGLSSLEPAHTNLKAGMKLHEGDRLTVMSESRLRIRLSSGAVAELGPHSEVLLKRALDGDPLLRLPHGELLLVSKGDHVVDVRTSQLKLKVSAKAFYLSQKLDKPAVVCVCDGMARAKWPLGQATLRGKEHEHSPVRIDNLKEALSPVPESEAGHDDVRIEALRKLL